MDLRYKAWTPLLAEVDPAMVVARIDTVNRLSNPEALLWIWRNKATAALDLLYKLNFVNTVNALSLPKRKGVWQFAPKSLKKLFLDSIEFQEEIVKDDTEEYFSHCLDLMSHCSGFDSSEKQSFFVKLSRKYPNMKSVIEGQGAAKLMAGDKDSASKEDTEEHLTSVLSYNQRVSELGDIINVQIPENTEAISVARSHGDLRENAEYAAAKERQAFLNERRAQLELDISRTRPTDFSDIIFEDSVIVGCSVRIEYDGGGKDMYHILGAWDSVPDKKYVSYQTKFGKAMIAKKVGDVVSLPDKRICKILDIKPLSDKIKDELSV